MADSTDTTTTTDTAQPTEFDAQAAFAALQAQLEKLAGVVDKRINGLHQKVTAAPKEAPATPTAPKTEAPSPGLSMEEVQKMISARIEADRLIRDLPEDSRAEFEELGFNAKQLAAVANLLKNKSASPADNSGPKPTKPGKAHAPPAPGGPAHPKTVKEYRELLNAKDAASIRRVTDLDNDPTFDPSRLG